MDERAREAISDQLLEIAGDEFTLAQVRGELTDTVIAALDAAGYAIVPKTPPDAMKKVGASEGRRRCLDASES